MGDAASAAALDVTGLTSSLTLAQFQGVIQALLPVVAVAVLAGFLFYAIRWAISLFRGI